MISAMREGGVEKVMDRERAGGKLGYDFNEASQGGLTGKTIV